MDKYIVTHDEIESSEGVQQTHPLNDNAHRRVKNLGDVTGLKNIGVHIFEVQPGRQSTEPHFHHHEEECIYILEGEALATIGDSTFTVRSGDFIGYRAGGEPHGLENSGVDVLRYLVIGQRLAHDVVDYPNIRKRLFINENLPMNLVDFDDLTDQN